MGQSLFPPREVRCKYCRQKFFRPYHTSIRYCSNECRLNARTNPNRPSNFRKFGNDIANEVVYLYMTGNSAAEVKEQLNLQITERSIQRFLKARVKMRTAKEAFELAMKKGRMSWDHLKKEGRAKEYQKGINSRLRYSVLQRDNFRCVLCGNGANEGVRLEVDHIISRTEGGSNEIENLRTLCAACNLGRWNVEQKAKWRTTRNWPKDLKSNLK